MLLPPNNSRVNETTESDNPEEPKLLYIIVLSTASILAGVLLVGLWKVVVSDPKVGRVTLLPDVLIWMSGAIGFSTGFGLAVTRISWVRLSVGPCFGLASVMAALGVREILLRGLIQEEAMLRLFIWSLQLGPPLTVAMTFAHIFMLRTKGGGLIKIINFPLYIICGMLSSTFFWWDFDPTKSPFYDFNVIERPWTWAYYQDIVPNWFGWLFGLAHGIVNYVGLLIARQIGNRFKSRHISNT